MKKEAETSWNLQAKAEITNAREIYVILAFPIEVFGNFRFLELRNTMERVSIM
jgi:hypothetical protein